VITIEWGLLIIALLLVLDLAIAATRVSFTNARAFRLSAEEGQNEERLKRVLLLIESPRLGAVLRLSQTLMRFGIAILSFILLQNWGGSIGFQIISLLLVAVIMLLVEFSIEFNVAENAEIWAMQLAFLGRILLFLFTPLVILPLLLLNPRRISRDTFAQMTEDELKTWIVSDEESGSLEPEERRMIYEIFQFGETLAREIMVPRIDVLALDEETATLSSSIEAFITSGYSRLPIYKESIDNILGFLYAKDLLNTLGKSENEIILRDLLRSPYFIPETKKADELLSEMQEKRFHMAIVVDEYGGVSGIVTLEDIIEEIIGEIQDEYDEREEALYQELGDDKYLFHGRIDLDDFADIVGIELPNGDADTLAGYLYKKLGRVPLGGETVRVNGLLLTIEQVLGRRIRRVRVVHEAIPPEETINDDSNNE